MLHSLYLVFLVFCYIDPGEATSRKIGLLSLRLKGRRSLMMRKTVFKWPLCLRFGRQVLSHRRR